MKNQDINERIKKEREAIAFQHEQDKRQGMRNKIADLDRQVSNGEIGLAQGALYSFWESAKNVFDFKDDLDIVKEQRQAEQRILEEANKRGEIDDFVYHSRKDFNYIIDAVKGGTSTLGTIIAPATTAVIGEAAENDTVRETASQIDDSTREAREYVAEKYKKNIPADARLLIGGIVATGLSVLDVASGGGKRRAVSKMKWKDLTQTKKSLRELGYNDKFIDDHAVRIKRLGEKENAEKNISKYLRKKTTGEYIHNFKAESLTSPGEKSYAALQWRIKEAEKSIEIDKTIGQKLDINKAIKENFLKKYGINQKVLKADVDKKITFTGKGKEALKSLETKINEIKLKLRNAENQPKLTKILEADLEKEIKGRKNLIKKYNPYLNKSFKKLNEVFHKGDLKKIDTEIEKLGFKSIDDTSVAIKKWDDYREFRTDKIPKQAILPQATGKYVSLKALNHIINNGRFAVVRKELTAKGKLPRELNDNLRKIWRKSKYKTIKDFRNAIETEYLPALNAVEKMNRIETALTRIQKSVKKETVAGEPSNVLDEKDILHHLEKAVGKGNVKEYFNDFKMEGDTNILNMKTTIRHKDGSISAIFKKSEDNFLHTRANEKVKKADDIGSFFPDLFKNAWFAMRHESFILSPIKALQDGANTFVLHPLVRADARAKNLEVAEMKQFADVGMLRLGSDMLRMKWKNISNDQNLAMSRYTWFQTNGFEKEAAGEWKKLTEPSRDLVRLSREIIHNDTQKAVYKTAEELGYDMGNRGEKYFPTRQFKKEDGFLGWLTLNKLKRQVRKTDETNMAIPKKERFTATFGAMKKRRDADEIKVSDVVNNGVRYTDILETFISERAKVVEMNRATYQAKKILDIRLKDKTISKAEHTYYTEMIDMSLGQKKSEYIALQITDKLSNNLAFAYLAGIRVPLKQGLTLAGSIINDGIGIGKKASGEYAKTFKKTMSDSDIISHRTLDSINSEVGSAWGKVGLGAISKADKEFAGSQSDSIANKVVRQLNKDGLIPHGPEEKVFQRMIDEYVDDKIMLLNGPTQQWRKAAIHRGAITKHIFMFTNPTFSMFNNYMLGIMSARGITGKSVKIARALAASATVAYFDAVITKLAFDWGTEEEMGKDIMMGMVSTVPLIGIIATNLGRDGDITNTLGPVANFAKKAWVQASDDFTVGKYDNGVIFTQREKYNTAKTIGNAFGFPRVVTNAAEGFLANKEGGKAFNNDYLDKMGKALTGQDIKNEDGTQTGKLAIAREETTMDKLRLVYGGSYAGINSTDYFRHRFEKKGYAMPSNSLLHSKDKTEVVQAWRYLVKHDRLTFNKLFEYKDFGKSANIKYVMRYKIPMLGKKNLTRKEYGSELFKIGQRKKDGMATKHQYAEYLLNVKMVENKNAEPDWKVQFDDKIKIIGNQKMTKPVKDYMKNLIMKNDKIPKEIKYDMLVKLKKIWQNNLTNDIIKSSRFMSPADWNAFMKTQKPEIQEQLINELNKE